MQAESERQTGSIKDPMSTGRLTRGSPISGQGHLSPMQHGFDSAFSFPLQQVSAGPSVRLSQQSVKTSRSTVRWKEMAEPGEASTKPSGRWCLWNPQKAGHDVLGMTNFWSRHVMPQSNSDVIMLM